MTVDRLGDATVRSSGEGTVGYTETGPYDVLTGASATQYGGADLLSGTWEGELAFGT